MSYPDRTNTNFPLASKAHLANLKFSEKEQLRYHQYVILKYFEANPDSRGLLEFIDMGLGKTILASAITYFYKQHDPDRRILVLASKSLAPNFKKGVKKYMEFLGIPEKEINDFVEKNYKFVSLNAGNMMTQVRNSDKTKEQILFEKKMEKMNDHILKNKGFLENTLVVVDEAHNLFNAIKNGSTNAMGLYDAILNTKNIKLLFLTGTPIINTPFELVPCFNMLSGLIRMGSNVTTLFPENEEKFEKFFIDHKTKKIKNKDKFQNRIIGMISYFGDMYFKEKPKEFPAIKGPNIIKVPMSPYQFTNYDASRDAEKEESTFAKSEQAGRFASGSKSSSTYRIKSRLSSNFVFPERAMGPRIGKKSRKKFLNKLTNEDLTKNLHKYSPKMAELLRRVQQHKGHPGTIYSQFVSGEGLGVFAKILELNGYSPYDASLKNYGIKSKKTFALITGKLTADDRNQIVEDFNSGKILLLLFSQAGAEGLDLKGSRHVHIMEPFWNYALIRQVMYRSVRFKSHTHLPKKHQDVTVYIYLSTYPKNFERKNIKEQTTDEELYKNSTDKDAINRSFLTTLPEVAVDCHAHAKNFDKAIQIRCKLCEPTNKPLFHPLLGKDMQISNPCRPVQEQKIKAKECVFEGTGEKFYFTKTPVKGSLPSINIYQKNPSVKGYVLMDPANEMYHALYEKILNNKC